MLDPVVRTACGFPRTVHYPSTMHSLVHPSRWHGDEIVADTIREVVLGAEDGTVQNIARIAGMVAAGLSASMVVIVGVLNAVASGKSIIRSDLEMLILAAEASLIGDLL